MNKKSLLLLIPFAAAALAGCTPAQKPDQCPTAQVELNQTTLEMTVGGTATLSIKSISVEGCTFEWKSSKPEVVEVDSAGTLSAKAVGEAVVSYGTGSCVVTVKPAGAVVHVVSVAFAQASYAVQIGSTVSVSATVSPDNATDKGVTYSLKDVSPEGCATISGAVITGVAEGTAKVVATSSDGGKTAEVPVTISNETPIPPGPVTTTITPAEAIALMDAAGDGVVVSGLQQVKGVCAAGSKYDSQYKQYTTGFDGVSNFKLQFTDNNNILNGGSPDGMEIVVEGYLEKYQGKYQLSYLPESASPTGQKFTPNLVSAQEVHHEGVLESITVSEAHREFYVGGAFVPETVTAHYSDTSTANVTSSAEFSGYNMLAEGTQTVSVSYTEGEVTKTTTYDIVVNHKDPVVGGAVYTFTNSDGKALNMSDWDSATFMGHVVVDGAEIITGMKDQKNAYIGANGGSGDNVWNIWNCLKVGKSGEQGTVTLLLDGTAGFEKIKVSAIGSRDDGTLTINGITKNVTKKAVKGNLEPMELEYDISGGINELKISSKEASSNNYAISITRLEFVGKQEATLDSITADMTNKTYEVGQELSLEGLTVIGHYSDGSAAPITEGYETSLQAGHVMALTDTSLTVSYNDLHADIALVVTDPTLVLESISASGVKEKYIEGEKLGAITVTAHYEGGETSDVTAQAELKINGALVTSEHVMALGETQLDVSYSDKEAHVTLNVVSDTIVSIAVSEEHRSFYIGDTFVKETVTATHLSGKTSDVTNEASFSSVDMSTAGEKEITVTYGELTPIKYTITVTKLVVFEKATDIAVGDIVALVNEDAKKEMTSVTDIGVVSDYTNNITHSFELEVVAGSQTNTFAFKNGDKYLNFTGSSNKLYLTAETVTDESSWTVEFSDGNVTIKNVAASTRFIQYNASQPRFACYTNAQKSVQLYKAPADPAVLQEIVVSTNNHREFYLNSEFVPETIMAKYDKGADVDVTDKAVFEDYDMESAGEQTVKVSYGGKEISYSITVLPVPAPVVDVTGVSLNEAELDLVVDEKATLVATVAPADASNKNVTWLSNNESVATVVDGVVTAVGEGEATITVTTVDQGKTATCTVTVSPKPTPTGDTTLDFTQIEGFSEWTNSYSQHIVEYTDVIVTFDGASKQSSTISNMPVGKDAPVTIVAKEGKNLNYFSAEFAKWNTNNQTVNVEYSTDFGKTFVSLDVSTTTFAIEKTNLPKGTSAIRFKPVESKQIGYSKVVTNIISAQTPDDVAVTGVSLDNTELILGATKSEQLVATVAPINATNKNVVWSVIEGDEFVSVDQTGVVTGLKVGEGVVQVATVDGDFKATCTVTVSDDAPTTKEATLDLTGSKASWDPQTVKKDESASYTVGEFVFTAYGGSASNASTAGYSESYRTYSGSYVEISLPTDSKYASFASMTMNVGSKDGSTSGGYKISADTIDDVSGTIKAAAASPAEVVVEKLNGATIIRIACTSGQLRYVSFNFVMNLK